MSKVDFNLSHGAFFIEIVGGISNGWIPNHGTFDVAFQLCATCSVLVVNVS